MNRSKQHQVVVATGEDHRTTPAELFFDLVFVYAITQVTALMAADPSALRLLGAGVVLALLWWCWGCFAWLGNVVRADAGAVFGVLVAVMAVVLAVSLTVPEVYADGSGGVNAPLVFVLCYGVFRLLHLVTYRIAQPEDRELHAVLRRTALTSVAPPFALLLAGSFFTGVTQILIWLCAVAVDYAAIYAVGSSGWRIVSPGHFAERHGLIVIIALGESIVAIGVGVSGFTVTYEILAAAAAALLLSATFWLLYFKQVSGPAEERLQAAEGDARTRLGSHVYTFLHLPLIGGVVLTALGMEATFHQVADTGNYDLSDPLHGLESWALPGGAGLFLLGSAAVLCRVGRRPPLYLLVGGAVLLAAGPAVSRIPALLALVLLTAVLAALVLLQARTARRPEVPRLA